MSEENKKISYCVANKVVVNKNNSNNNYEINYSKIKNVYFYNSRIDFWESEINNFFIFDKDLHFMDESKFLNYQKIKCFGECVDLKKKILNKERFKKGIIHIE